MKVDSSKVTVIAPIFNEEKHIRKTLECIIDQDFTGDIEIVIVDGNSSDNSVKIIEEVSKTLPKNRTIKVFSNPKRYIPVSLNIACENASNPIIVRIDGHTYAPLDYVSQSVKVLESIDFNGIVGGRWKISAGDKTILSEAIAITVSHKAGVGNAQYRTFSGDVNEYVEVDTVPFGAFTKELWQNIGGYDEKLLYDEDYDFNYKARKFGYKIIMNPAIVLNYFARKNLKLLWIQYYRYGYWANKFCVKHKIVPTIRRLVPVCFVLAHIILLLISRPLFIALVACYLITITIISMFEGLIKRKNLLLGLNMISVFPTLHFSYGIGSLISMINSAFEIFRR